MQTPSPDLEGALRKSFAVIKQLKQDLLATRLTANPSVQEPIAIVAMSCRFPGGANSPEAFWQNLCDGRDNLSEIPADRWNWQNFYHPDATAPGTHYVRHGYFIDRVSDFDPEFFGIAGREAACMDPQQRLLLEVSWETLERAALSADQLRGSRTGVFVGIGQNDYAQLQMYGGAPERITPYDGTGISFCFAAARLSYTLGLNGPNLAVDTACSSSLVALHLACNSLANRECDQALAGGSHLVISPEVTIYLSRLKALSADGRSKAFAADADGYGRGEGCGILLLKRLADAQRDGDPVLAVIRGSAVNHGGAGSGLTVPNGLAQQLLLRQALERAGLKPSEIGWIEAHGTGTALGDPIEVAALGEIFKKEERAGQPLYLSSVKTNIGHLEAAAGIAGVIKAVLALQHGELPPHLHLGTANPHIDWQNHPFQIPTQRTPWHGPQVAGISAFGLGGTNAHVIIGAADTATPAKTAPPLPHALPGALPHALPLLLSARTPEALAKQRDAFIAHLETTDSPYAAISQTAALGRRHFEYRLSVAASSAASAAARLRQTIVPGSSPAQQKHSAPRIAFLFTGQGSQYCAMGRTLWQQEAVFRTAVEHCASLIEKQAGWSPLPFINSPADDPRIDQTAFTQPTLFALQVGLVSLWRAWGISPAMVIGHSIGEFAAAWCAGMLSLEDAVALVVERGRLMQQLPAGGGMAALRTDAATARQFIAPFPQLALAASNAPQAVSIAGPLPQLERCLQQIEAAGMACQRLPVSHAFHSSLMEPMLGEFAQTLARTRFMPPTLEFIATGGDAPATVTDPGYWREQIRNPVNFAAAAACLAERQADIVIEIGPSAPLLALARQSVDLPQTLWLPSLDRHNPDALADSLGKLYVAGVNLPWLTIFAGPRQPALLPTYPFQRRRCWVEANSAKHPGSKRRADDEQHPLLGSRIASPLVTQQYSVDISARQPAFLADHRVLGEIIYPAAAYIEASLSAAARHFGQTALRLCDIEFRQALPLTAEQPRQLQLILTPQAGECAISIHSCDPTTADPNWVAHMSCRAMPLPKDGELALLPIGRPTTLTPGAAFYQASRERGIDYGPAFQTLQSLENHDKESGQADYSVLASHAGPHFLLPPVLFDTALQALAAASPDLGEQTWIPAAIAQLDFTPGSALSGRVVSRIDQTLGADSVACSVQLYTPENQPSLTARGIRMQRVKAGLSQAAPIWLPRWVATALPAAPGKPDGNWLLLGDDAQAATELAQSLRAAGCTVSLIDSRTPLDSAWLATQAFTAVCCFALRADTLAAPASRELALIQQLSQLPEDAQPTLRFVTRGAQSVEINEEATAVSRGALWGLARVARNEFPALRCVCIDLDPIASHEENNAYLIHEFNEFHESHEFASQQKGDDKVILPEDQLAWRQKTRYALRLQAAHTPLAAQQPVTGRLHCNTIGDLDSLAFTDQPVVPPGAGEIQVRVRAASLNFKDVLHALGMLPMPEHSAFGFDAAGVVTAVGAGATPFTIGDRVMLSLTPGTLATVVNARHEFVCRLPAGFSFASAAALPLAYLTAWHALVNVAQLQAGEHILIHAAAGGVGQAALAIARLLGAHIHATASPGKQDHLRQNGVTQIYSSRSTAFREEILAATAGRGVDVVLNCLNGELIAASFATLKPAGRFVEIGKAGIWSPAAALACRPDVRYAAFDLADVASANPAQITQMLGELADRLAQGQLPALPIQAFPATQVAAAFRLIARSRHIGKVVVTFPASDSADGVQLLTGAFGALGRLLCQALVARGEKRLALLVRNPPNEEQQAFLATLGADVRIAAYPVALHDAEAVRHVVQQISQDFACPLNALYHAAGVLADAALPQQTPASFARVAEAKLLGAWHLHQATRHLDLQHFVLFSSAAALIGTPGQASYAVANAGLDALAAARRGAGLSALSVNWGPWGDSGMAARLSDIDQQRMRAAGITPLAAEPAWQALFQLADTDIAQAMVMNVDWSRFVARLPGAATASLFREVALTAPPAPHESVANDPTNTSAQAPGQLLSQVTAQPAGQRRQALFRQLQQRVAGILGRPHPEEIPTTQGFFAMGMDSLTSMELRMSLQRELAVSLPATLLFDYGTIEALADYLLAQIPAWQLRNESEITSRTGSPIHLAVGRASARHVGLKPDLQLPAWQLTASVSSDDLGQFSEAELADMLARELRGD